MIFFLIRIQPTTNQESIEERADLDSSNSIANVLETFSWIQVGSVVWVQEGTQQGIRGKRSIAYVGKVEKVYGDGNVSVSNIIGSRSRIERCEHLSEGSIALGDGVERKEVSCT